MRANSTLGSSPSEVLQVDALIVAQPGLLRWDFHLGEMIGADIRKSQNSARTAEGCQPKDNGTSVLNF